MADMSEKELKVFVDAVTHYFTSQTRSPAEVTTAYLAEHDLPAYDYTGVIDISGGYQGSIYFSAPRLLLRQLLLEMREPDIGEHNILDVVGEVANTISGNARQHFGSLLDISVPRALHVSVQKIVQAVRQRAFVILLRWQHYEAAVVIDVVPN
jgi:chemotaxis protein CheX